MNHCEEGSFHITLAESHGSREISMFHFAEAIENLIGEDNAPGTSQLFETIWPGSWERKIITLALKFVKSSVERFFSLQGR